MIENVQWKKEPRQWNWKAATYYRNIQFMGIFKVATSQVEWSSSCELLHYGNLCAPEEHHDFYGKSAPFSHRSPGIHKG